MTREATNELIEIAETMSTDELLRLLRDVLTYMSEDEVRDFAEGEGYIDSEEDEEQEEFDYENDDEVNDAFEEDHPDLDWSDLPAVREAFSLFVDCLNRDGRISDELAQNVTLRNDD